MPMQDANGTPDADRGAATIRPAATDTAVPELPNRDCALFFDFDGTLVDLAPHPAQVIVEPTVPGLLAGLQAALGGALALVSGRPVAEIDHHLPSLQFAAAGVHGAERRAADGDLLREAAVSLDDAATLIEALCGRFPALRLERKPGAMALHFRQAPELEGLCVAAMQDALERSEGTALQRGKMVIELKPRGASKAKAVDAFMSAPPFRQRRPWFFGDDVTDESAFDYVQAAGGVAVKIGEGATRAAHRLPDPAALHGWMARALAVLAQTPAARVRR